MILALAPIAALAAEAAEPELKAADVRYPVTVTLALGGAGTEEGGAVHTGSRLLVNFGHGVAFDLGSRGFTLGDVEIGGLTFGGRYTTPWGPHVRLALAHHHETPTALVEAKPFEAMTATLDGIQHRSGIEGAIGWDVPLSWGKKARWGWVTEVSYSRFLDHDGAMNYTLVDTGLSFDLGKPRLRG
jgi:hypothetical protein